MIERDRYGDITVTCGNAYLSPCQASRSPQPPSLHRTEPATTVSSVRRIAGARIGPKHIADMVHDEGVRLGGELATANSGVLVR